MYEIIFPGVEAASISSELLKNTAEKALRYPDYLFRQFNRPSP
jgi:hypothetical protein